MKTEKGYLKRKMERAEYRLMRCLAVYLYCHNRRDLLWMHYTSRLKQGDLESCEALLMAFAEMQDRKKARKFVSSQCHVKTLEVVA